MTSGSSQPEELCLVCQDISTGYHYGVPSCNGCKTFFRRAIVKKQTFVCQYDGKCAVDKSIRCACRHCRLEKCLRVGMDRSAIQQNRDPIGYTKRTRRYPMVKTISSAEENSPGRSVSESTADQLAEDQLLEALADVERKCEKMRRTTLGMNLDKSLIEVMLSPSTFLDSSFLEALENDTSSTSVILHPAQQSDYQFWHHRDWSIMTEWAKMIPVFQNLPLSDRLALLRHSGITYPSLLQCYFSPDRGPDTIVFANGAFFDRTPEPERCSIKKGQGKSILVDGKARPLQGLLLNRGLGLIKMDIKIQERPLGFQKRKYQMLDQLLIPIRKLKVDITEFAAFKAIFFLNPDADDVNNISKEMISDGRCSVTNALYRYMVRRSGVEEGADRFGKLLLLGTVLATMAVEMKEAVVIADFFDQIHFSPFAKQLLFGIKHEDIR